MFVHPSEATYLLHEYDNRHLEVDDLVLIYQSLALVTSLAKVSTALYEAERRQLSPWQSLEGSVWERHLMVVESFRSGQAADFGFSCCLILLIQIPSIHTQWGIGVPSCWQCVCYPIMNHIAISSSCF